MSLGENSSGEESCAQSGDVLAELGIRDVAEGEGYEEMGGTGERTDMEKRDQIAVLMENWADIVVKNAF